MEVEVLFGGLRLRVRRREPGKGRGCRDHQERQSLGARRREAVLLAILDMIGVYAIDGIQQLGFLVG